MMTQSNKTERLMKERQKHAEMLAQTDTLVLDEEESKWFFQILEREFLPTKAMLELNKTRRRDIVVRI